MGLYKTRLAFPICLALCGCNETMGNSAPVADAPVQRSAVGFPAGTACGREIDRFNTIIKADLATGNVEQSVYDRMQADITRASRACAGGHGGEALSILASTKSAHGYAR